MNGDHMPGGGHRRKKATKQQIAKMIEGGKKAQEIERKTRAQHEQEEVPKAEEKLLQDLEGVENTHLESAKK